jgi:hypothetical protein
MPCGLRLRTQLPKRLLEVALTQVTLLAIVVLDDPADGELARAPEPVVARGPCLPPKAQAPIVGVANDAGEDERDECADEAYGAGNDEEIEGRFGDVCVLGGLV